VHATEHHNWWNETTNTANQHVTKTLRHRHTHRDTDSDRQRERDRQTDRQTDVTL